MNWVRKDKINVDLSDVLENLKEDIFTNINCIQIGTIENFYPEKQTADINLSVKKVKTENEDGSLQLEDRGFLLECPVVILNGGKGEITFPIEKGDSCLVFFNDRDIDNWFFDGDGRPPNTYRKHDISDGIALVGINNLQNSISDYLTEGVRVKFDDVKIEMITGFINSLATLWTHTGNMNITGTLNVLGGTGGAGTSTFTRPVRVEEETSAKELKADNGWTGTFATGDGRTVTVVSGIIIGVN